MTESAATLNIPLARKVLEHLIAHPSEHDQEAFGRQTACGTVMCIAGTAMWMADEPFKWDKDGFMVMPVEDDDHGVDDAAAQLLGMTHRDAVDLFYTMENQYALEMLASHIADAEQVQHA